MNFGLNFSSFPPKLTVVSLGKSLHHQGMGERIQDWNRSFIACLRLADLQGLFYILTVLCCIQFVSRDVWVFRCVWCQRSVRPHCSCDVVSPFVKTCPWGTRKTVFCVRQSFLGFMRLSSWLMLRLSVLKQWKHLPFYRSVSPMPQAERRTGDGSCPFAVMAWSWGSLCLARVVLHINRHGMLW